MLSRLSSLSVIVYKFHLPIIQAIYFEQFMYRLQMHANTASVQLLVVSVNLSYLETNDRSNNSLFIQLHERSKFLVIICIFSAPVHVIIMSLLLSAVYVLSCCCQYCDISWSNPLICTEANSIIQL